MHGRFHCAHDSAPAPDVARHCNGSASSVEALQHFEFEGSGLPGIAPAAEISIKSAERVASLLRATPPRSRSLRGIHMMKQPAPTPRRDCQPGSHEIRMGLERLCQRFRRWDLIAVVMPESQRDRAALDHIELAAQRLGHDEIPPPLARRNKGPGDRVIVYLALDAKPRKLTRRKRHIEFGWQKQNRIPDLARLPHAVPLDDSLKLMGEETQNVLTTPRPTRR